MKLHHLFFFFFVLSVLNACHTKTVTNKGLQDFKKEQTEIKSKKSDVNKTFKEIAIELFDAENRMKITEAEFKIIYQRNGQSIELNLLDEKDVGVYILKDDITDVYNFKIFIRKEGYQDKRIPILDIDQIPKLIELNQIKQ